MEFVNNEQYVNEMLAAINIFNKSKVKVQIEEAGKTIDELLKEKIDVIQQQFVLSDKTIQSGDTSDFKFGNLTNADYYTNPQEILCYCGAENSEKLKNNATNLSDSLFTPESKQYYKTLKEIDT